MKISIRHSFVLESQMEGMMNMVAALFSLEERKALQCLRADVCLGKGVAVQKHSD